MFDILLMKYKQINRERKKFGDLLKCEFHIHTPASYDYKLVPGKEYKNLTSIDVVHIANQLGYFDEEQTSHFVQEISAGYYDTDEYKVLLKNTPYQSIKEYITYKLIAHKLYLSGVEIAVISDHNTINGYFKLKHSLEEYFKERIKGKDENRKIINLLLGIEISCSEQLHLVGIFDEKYLSKVQKLVDNNIISEEKGTYETSLSMMGKIHEIGGIGYIAHINSAEINTSGLYKHTLFNLPYMNVIGVTNKRCINRELERLKSFDIVDPEEKYCFIFEGDAHTINQLGLNNTWIKMSDVSFNSLRKAFLNHKFCVFIDKPSITNKFIKGILIEPGSDGYLRGKNDSSFLADFSSDLNCIIGGRGTGKSTLLSILEIIFTLETDSDKKLRFICKNKMIYVLFVYDDKEYMLRFIPQVEEAARYSSGRQFYSSKAFVQYYPNQGLIKLEHHWVNLYEVINQTDVISFNEISQEEKLLIMSGFYRKSYSINNIINQINSDDIGTFIREVVFNGLPFPEKDRVLKSIASINRMHLKKFLATELPSLKSSMLTRESFIDEKIGLFNTNYSNQLQIIYSPKEKNHAYYLDDLTAHFISNSYLPKINITWGDIERFIQTQVEQVGLIDFLILIMSDQFRKLEQVVSILKFSSSEERNFDDVDEEIRQLTSSDIPFVYKRIKDKLVENKLNLELCLGKYFEIIDDFTLQFNVNSRESVNSIGVNMKDISLLSLGQKVVAILTFLFEYGKFTADNTPLIIDQPEDNLDNQYIYKNLVNSLRQIKNNRQIIVVTHSSTIVTNADAEQVIVLESNNAHGWIEKSGYPSNKTIMKHIINYLEGGEPSFKHKMNMYKTIIHKLDA
ncbi:Spaf_1101 family AAA-like ATPase [Paenibacillus sp.]